MKLPKPFCRIFKSTSPANRCQYVGTLLTPDGKVYALELDVAEHDRGDGTKGQHFEGTVLTGQQLVDSMLRTAQVDGTLPRSWQDLVDQAQAVPDPDDVAELERCPF